MKPTSIAAAGIILLSVVAGLYFYPQLPERVASHWNIYGQADGWLPKFWVVFFIPFLATVLYLLLESVPSIDPLGHNIKKFKQEYDTFVVLLVAFLFYIHMLVLLINTGVRLDIFQWIAPGFAILFYYFGILSEKSHRNWFVGFRTPWAMSSDKVWHKTNRRGAKLFKLVGVISLVGVVMPKYWMLVILFSAMAVVFYTVIYSYKVWKKESRKNRPVFAWRR